MGNINKFKTVKQKTKNKNKILFKEKKRNFAKNKQNNL